MATAANSSVAMAPVEPMPAAVLERLRERFQADDPHALCLNDYRLMLDEIDRLRSENVKLSLAGGVLRQECRQLVQTWTNFMLDEGSINPLDYPIGDRVEAVRRAMGTP